MTPNIDEIIDRLNDCAKFTDTPLRRYRGFDRDECLRILTEFRFSIVEDTVKESSKLLRSTEDRCIELLKDKQRLDWLDEGKSEDFQDSDYGTFWCIAGEVGVRRIRDAIDAAMKPTT